MTSSAFIQGSDEWLALRKSKITATDASIIMDANPWKSKAKLFEEKMNPDFRDSINPAMQRGIDLEPIARDLFNLKTGLNLQPDVVVAGWQMVSFDGYCPIRKIGVEIKCPGEKAHALALAGKVPEYYYAQLQHQIHVGELKHVFYFSFDGFDGVSIPVVRDDEYIKKMNEKEWEFYQCMVNNTPPESDEKEFIFMESDEWNRLAIEFQEIMKERKELDEREKSIRETLIGLAGQSNAKGAGISLSKVLRKGTVDYGKIPELNGVDLDKYRKAETISWRITI